MENQKISPVETLAKGEEYKIKGNEFFKNGDIQKAMKKYHFSLMYVKALEKPTDLAGIPGTETAKKLSEDEKTKLESLRCQCHNNLAGNCYSILSVYSKSRQYNNPKWVEELEYVNKPISGKCCHFIPWRHEGSILPSLS